MYFLDLLYLFIGIIFLFIIFVEKMISLVISLIVSSFLISIVILALFFEYLSFIYLIIYFGAILMLFLFIVMLLNIDDFKQVEVFELSWSHVFGFALFLKVLFTLKEFLLEFSFGSKIKTVFIYSMSQDLVDKSSFNFFIILFNSYGPYILLIGVLLFVLMLCLLKLLVGNYSKQIEVLNLANPSFVSLKKNFIKNKTI